MRHLTALNHERRLAGIMASIYSSAYHSRMKHADLIQEVRIKVWEDPALKKCPSWVHHGLMVRREILAADIYAHLRWAYKGSDGKLYLNYTDLSESDKESVNNGSILGHHYWLQDAWQQRESYENGSLFIVKQRKLTESYY